MTEAIGADFAVPLADRYLEDYVPGSVYEYGDLTVTEAEILEFGERFDPQPMHTDPVAAVAGAFGGLVASGWHTTALMMRLYADHYLSHVASLGSPGVEELSWPAPVRPGDRLRLRVEIEDVRPSRTRPDRGVVRTRAWLRNQRGETVLSLTALNLVRRRPE
ncbi:MAG: MaoC family dehydratase [Candidatus Dormibacteraeota bacterium]|nr:MaoC family dehydratase [Candidatus Dormibacteraeota bacterium]MBO0705753.1 MaoC family dehydratase [Candidatus Dormibacteraeota bacterium]MBO0761829.1 MaoC family dehydratase [Candidatus Dormibacteraeota bacterium]